LKAPKPVFINAEQSSTFGFTSTVPHNNNSESHILLLYFIILPYFLLLVNDSDDDIYYNGLSSLRSQITRLIQIRTPN
jgi:hypothetical protein